MDVQLLNSLFTKTVAAARILGVDPGLQKQFEATRRQLPPMMIGKWGQLREWTDADIDDPNSHNRRVSDLYGLFPGDQIDPWKTPDLLKAAKVSLLARGDEATGWSLGWKTNLWARFRDGEHAYKILKLLIKPSYNAATGRWGSGLYPNMFDAHPSFQIRRELRRRVRCPRDARPEPERRDRSAPGTPRRMAGWRRHRDARARRLPDRFQMGKSRARAACHPQHRRHRLPRPLGRQNCRFDNAARRDAHLWPGPPDGGMSHPEYYRRVSFSP
jgi:hypothetical protein